MLNEDIFFQTSCIQSRESSFSAKQAEQPNAVSGSSGCSATKIRIFSSLQENSHRVKTPRFACTAHLLTGKRPAALRNVRIPVLLRTRRHPFHPSPERRVDEKRFAMGPPRFDRRCDPEEHSIPQEGDGRSGCPAESRRIPDSKVPRTSDPGIRRRQPRRNSTKTNFHGESRKRM